MDIKQIIKKLHKEYTYQALADHIGVSMRQMQYYATGENEPSYSKGKKLERLLGKK